MCGGSAQEPVAGPRCRLHWLCARPRWAMVPQAPLRTKGQGSVSGGSLSAFTGSFLCGRSWCYFGTRESDHGLPCLGSEQGKAKRVAIRAEPRDLQSGCRDGAGTSLSRSGSEVPTLRPPPDPCSEAPGPRVPSAPGKHICSQREVFGEPTCPCSTRHVTRERLDDGQQCRKGLGNRYDCGQKQRVTRVTMRLLPSPAPRSRARQHVARRDTALLLTCS